MNGLLGYTKSGFVIKTTLAVHFARVLSPHVRSSIASGPCSEYPPARRAVPDLELPTEVRSMSDNVSSFPYRASSLGYVIIITENPRTQRGA